MTEENTQFMNGKLPDLEKSYIDDSNGSDSSMASSADENKVRGNWSGKLEFVLSCLSYAVGLGNLWRFPYLCYDNGGGAFLIPYIIMMALAGVPLFFMELSFGQYASSGVVSIWKVSPLMRGVGVGMFLVSTFVAMYYNMIIAWTSFYLFSSFTSELPWGSCNNDWNTPACSLINVANEKNCSTYNGTYYKSVCYTESMVGADNLSHYQNLTKLEKDTRKSPSDEYFHNYVLDISDGFHNMGEVRWQLALCLLFSWVIVGACLSRGIKSSGKAVYFTATFPYLVLCILLVRCLTLEGSLNGIIYYLTPEWKRLLSAKVWGDAAVQIFFSLSPCWGGLITLASYNKFHNNALRDALVVSIGNCLTSIFAGFVIFGIIGYMAYELDVDISEVADKGPGLAFIVYPQVVTRLPISPLWSILFFSMLITLGLGTQFAVVQTVHTTILDQFPKQLRKGRRSMYCLVCICAFLYICGLSFCTRGGMYMLQLVDNYSASYSVLIIGFAECIALSWFYGVDKFMANIELMIGFYPGIWWKIAWKYVTPATLLFIMVFTWIDFDPSSYRGYNFPPWADVLGWMMSFTSVMAIPVVAIYQIVRADKSDGLWKAIKKLSQPTSEWGPALKIHREEEANSPYQMQTRHNTGIEENGGVDQQLSSRTPLTAQQNDQEHEAV